MLFDVQNLALFLTHEVIKFIDYKIMLKLQCKTTFNSVLNAVLYEIYSQKITVTEYFLHVCTFLRNSRHLLCLQSPPMPYFTPRSYRRGKLLSK